LDEQVADRDENPSNFVRILIGIT